MSYPKIGTKSSFPSNTNSGNYTFLECIRKAQDRNNKFIGFDYKGQNNKSTCYIFNNYDPLQDTKNPQDTSVYAVPNINCTDSLADCLRNAGKNFLLGELNQVQSELQENDKEKKNLMIREIAIKNNYTLELATKVYENQTQKSKLEKEKQKTSEYLQNVEMNLGAMNSANKNSNMSLTDKNRFLATVNSDVQNKNQKLMEVNDKINTITQDIYFNNITDKRKNYMIGLLKAITTIIIILMFCMIIYYGVKVADKNYGILNRFKPNNNFNNNNFNF